MRGTVSRHLHSFALLAVLGACVVGASLLDGFPGGQLLIAVAVTIPVWLSASVARSAGAVGSLGLWLIVLLIAMLGVFAMTGSSVGGYVSSAVGCAFYALTSVQLLVHAFGRDRDALGRLLDGVNAFLLVGFTYVALYAVVDHLAEGAFAHGQGHEPLAWGKLVYFSFSTLTTTGDGDIAPQHPIVRGLASIEQISGVFFTAGLVGRILGLAKASRGDGFGIHDDGSPTRPTIEQHVDERVEPSRSTARAFPRSELVIEQRTSRCPVRERRKIVANDTCATYPARHCKLARGNRKTTPARVPRRQRQPRLVQLR